MTPSRLTILTEAVNSYEAQDDLCELVWQLLK
jgi:hypothetical protein